MKTLDQAQRIQALEHLSRSSGLRLPFGIHPGGSLAEVDVELDTEAKWNAYGWNPPEFLRPGALGRVTRWSAPFVAEALREADERANDFAYKEQEAVPAWPAPTDYNVMPSGWVAKPGALPAWCVARHVSRVSEEHGFGQPDPTASPKPTWQQLTAAYAAAALVALRAVLLEDVNAQAKARIAAAYVGKADRVEELTWRLNGRATSEQDAERVRLIGVCHALEVRIAAAATVDALKAIDVVSDTAWAPSLHS